MRPHSQSARAIGWARRNALAIAAVMIASTGSALAAQVAGDGEKAQSAKDAAEVAKKKKKPKAKPGPAGPQGLPGPPGPPGQPGAAGLDGTGRAYASVRNAAFDPCTPQCTFERSKGITSVTSTSTGRYCVTAPGIDPAEVAAAVSVEYNNSGLGNWAAWSRADSGDCFVPNDDRFEVITVHYPSTTVCTNAACSATASVLGDAVLTNAVGFTIVIP